MNMSNMLSRQYEMKMNATSSKNLNELTTMSFPAFSALLAIVIAAAAAAPDGIPPCNIYKHKHHHQIRCHHKPTSQQNIDLGLHTWKVIFCMLVHYFLNFFLMVILQREKVLEMPGRLHIPANLLLHQEA